MKDQIALAKANGEICVAIPLFRMHHEDAITSLGGYTLSVTNSKPTAYVIDAGEEWGEPQLVNAKIAKKYLEFIGDL